MKQIIIIMGLLSVIFGCKSQSKKETIVSDGKSINVTTSTSENYKIDLADLNNEQVKFIQDKLVEAKILIRKYYQDSIDKLFDSKIIDQVLSNWRNDMSKDKKSAEEIIDIFGAAFGQGIVDELNCEWKVLTDQYGTDLTVVNKRFVVNGFPFSSVQKVVKEDNPRSLDDIKLVLKKQIEEAEEKGNVDERK